MIIAFLITTIVSFLFSLGVKEALKNEHGQLDILNYARRPNTTIVLGLLITAPYQIGLGWLIVVDDVLFFAVRIKAKFVLWRMAKKKEKQNPELAEDLRKLMRRF